MNNNTEKIPSQENTVRLGLGNVCIEMNSPTKEFKEKILSDSPSFIVSQKPDFRINFNLRNRLTAIEVKQLLKQSRSYMEDGHLYTKPELLDCRISWAEASLFVDTEKQLFDPIVDYKLMNPLIRGIYSGIHTRIRKMRPDAYLIHGCGIKNGERCFLFTGPSGSGKTTLATLAEGRQVLNDEAVLVKKTERGFDLCGTPFDGGVSSRSNTSGHLSAIIFLKHHTTVSLRKVNKAEAYHRILIQIFDTYPLYETQTAGNKSLEERADLSVKLASEVPAYELGFRPDTSFWPVVDEIKGG